MALSSITTLKPITDALGAADAILQAQLGLANVNSVPTVQMNLTTARSSFDAGKIDAEFDNAEKTLATLRTSEKCITASLGAILAADCAALDSFYNNQYGAKLRTYFKVTGATQWTDNFRALWRRVMKEELIVRLGSTTNTTGTWGAFSADKTIGSDANLEIRCITAITASVAVSITLNKLAGGTELVAINIPASTLINTVFPIKGIAGKYSGVVSISATGGENNDVLEVWVAL
jgi:hypothetical protein